MNKYDYGDIEARNNTCKKHLLSNPIIQVIIVTVTWRSLDVVLFQRNFNAYKITWSTTAFTSYDLSETIAVIGMQLLMICVM